MESAGNDVDDDDDADTDEDMSGAPEQPQPPRFQRLINDTEQTIDVSMEQDLEEAPQTARGLSKKIEDPNI